MALGIPRREMLARMSSLELSEWIAFASIEPFPGERLSAEHAMDRTVNVNMQRDPKKPAIKPEDMMIFTDRRELTEEEVAAKVAAMLGAPA